MFESLLDDMSHPKEAKNYPYRLEPNSNTDTGGETDYQLKVIFLGYGSVGKTSLITRLMYNSYGEPSPTICSDMSFKTVVLRGLRVQLQLWDTAGSETFRSAVSIYIRNSSIVIIVYDITDSESFDAVDESVRQVREVCDNNVAILIVGNKMDLQVKRQILTEEGKRKAQELRADFGETSAKTGYNVKKLLTRVVLAFINMRDHPTTSHQLEAISQEDSTQIELTNEPNLISDFPVVDQQHFREALNKSGAVKTRISKAIVQGPARVGKTSVKSLILSQPYKSIKSTCCYESPDIAVGGFAVSRYGQQEDEYHWELVDNEAMVEKFASEIRDLMSQQKKENNVESSRNSKEIKELPVDDQTTYTADTLDDDLNPLSSFKLSHPAKESVAAARVGEMELIHIVNKAQGKHGKLTFHKEWLYFIDCGGQIQFQQLIQAFIPCASVLILVTSLAENLSNQCSASFEYEEDKSYDVSDYLPSIETLLRHLTLMVSSSSFQQELVEGNELSDVIKIPKKLKVLIVATHRDLYEERLRNGEQIETIDEKEEKLEQIFMHIDDNLVFLNEKIFFEVDGRKASQEVFDDPAIKEIRAELRDQAFEIDIPLSWYAFEILLRERSSTPKGCGVLSLKDCETIGFSLGLKKEEAQSALKFFHLLNTILFYPGVSDLVFINPHCLIEVICELVVFVCESRRHVKSGRGTAECRKVVEQGKISKDVLNTISKKCSQISNFFPDHNFSLLLLQIFKHLLIATESPNKKKFFMPALLPLTDPFQFIPSSHFSLLLYFKKGVPLGLFCAMIVNLLMLRVDNSDDFFDDFVWSIDRTSIMFSNLITLQHYNMKGKVVFVESNDCFEVHFRYAEDKEKGEKYIHSTLNDTIKKRKFDSSKIKYKMASFCPCPKQPRHYAILHASGKLRCMISRDLIEDPDRQPDTSSSELMTTPSTRPQMSTKREKYTGFQDVGITLEGQMSTLKASREQVNVSQDVDSMGKEHVSTSLEILLDQQPDLKEITTHARTAEWHLLGVQLELDSVNLSGCTDLTSVYELWIEEKAEMATRRNLLSALRSINQNNVARKYENYLRKLVAEKEDTLETTKGVTNERVTIPSDGETGYQLKVVFLGHSSVGKTSLMTKLIYNTYDEHYYPTIPPDVLSKTIVLRGLRVKLKLWDTAGQERYQSIISNYIRKSSIVIVVYDITNSESFDAVDESVRQVREVCDNNVAILIVGNKMDLQDRRQILTEEGESKAQELRADFGETSAKTGCNVEELLESAVLSFINMRHKRKQTIDDQVEHSTIQVSPTSQSSVNSPGDPSSKCPC